MKIQCEQCKTEYNIDDAAIGERGIRAQCPRCNFITTIRKSQPAILDAARTKLDTAICVNCGKPTEPNPNDPIPICASCQALSAGEVGAKTAVSSNPPGSAGPFGASGAAPSFNAPAAAGGTPDTNIQWRIKKSPGGEIYGPFDRETISGWVETDKVVPADEISRVGGPWRPATEHEDFLPIFAKRYNLAKKVGTGTAVTGAGAGEGLGLEGGEKPVNTGTRSSPGRGIPPPLKPKPTIQMPWGVMISIGVALALVGTVAFLFVQGIIPTPNFSQPTPVPVADGTDKRLDAIRDENPGASGSSAEHLTAALALMAADTVEGWTAARKELHLALALDRSNLDAMAATAEVDALLAMYDQQTGYLDEAFRFAARATERAPQNPAAFRAKAAALLASRNVANRNEARAVLESNVLPAAPEDPVNLTMVALATRGTDDVRAEELLKKAAAAAPAMIRPPLELGVLYENQRRYQKALETFRPIADKSFLASLQIGQIEEEVGNYKEAAAAYRAAAKLAEAGGGRTWVEASIAAAVIQYQALGNPKEASASLAPLESKYLADGATEKLRGDQLGRLRLHLAIVARLQGQLDRSLALSAKAAADRDGGAEVVPAAHFNAGLANLRKADWDGAEREFEEADAPGITGRQKSEIYFWQAQLRAKRGDVAGAGSKYEDAVREDGHNWRAIVGNAVLLADNLERQVEGIEKMQDLAKTDPNFYEQYQRVTLFHPDPSRELLDRAAIVFGKVYESHATDPRSSAALGLVAYLAGNKAKADRYFQTALSEQTPDAASQIYSGLIAEARGGKGDLSRALERFTLMKSQAGSPFLSTAIGRVRMQQGDFEKAAGELEEALNRSPDYAPAHYWLGVLYQKRGDKRQALAKWGDALKHDPNYLRASRAILELDAS